MGLQAKGPLRELNPGPLAPEARIIPLDQAASDVTQLHTNHFPAAAVLIKRWRISSQARHGMNPLRAPAAIMHPGTKIECCGRGHPDSSTQQ
jgi:hypothetical protein